jgi:nucleotide-binding universal stress UspA family protein
MDPRYVLVGVDDRMDAVAAARFGAEEAAARGLGLMLAYGYAGMPVRAQSPGGPAIDRLRRATAAVHRVAEHLVLPAEMALETTVEDAAPLELLGRLAERADRIVIGQHHLSVRERIPDPSLGTQLADVVSCPVLIVPAQPRARRGRPPVVVALDGETDAGAALELAFEQAERRQLMLLALHAAPLHTLRSSHQGDERDLAEILAGWKADHPDVTVQTLVSAADPSDLIVQASRNAAVMVIGRPRQRQLGGWSRSVAGAVVKLARCPLVIAPSRSHDPVVQPA